MHTRKDTGNFGHEAFDGSDRNSSMFVLHSFQYVLHLQIDKSRSEIYDQCAHEVCKQTYSSGPVHPSLFADFTDIFRIDLFSEA